MPLAIGLSSKKELKPLKDVKHNVLRHVRAALRHGATVAAAATLATQRIVTCLNRWACKQAGRNRPGSTAAIGSGPLPALGERSTSASHRRNIITNTFDAIEFTATDLRIALNEIFPEATYGSIPVIDQYDALEAYLALDDCALTDAPEAFAAYVIHEQPSAVQAVRETQRPSCPDSNHRTANFASTKLRRTS